MKKTLLAGICLCLCLYIPGMAQKRIIKDVHCDLYSIVRFDRIEITDKETVADVTLQYIPGWWINIGSGSYLEEEGSDRQYKLLRSEGFPLDTNLHMPPVTGEMTAKFYFEPIGRDVKSVNFREAGDESGRSDALCIRLTSEKESHPLPDGLRGNWLASDGSNEWVIGLWDKFAIYKNRFWDYKTVNIKGQSAEIILKADGEEIPLFIKAGKDRSLYAEVGRLSMQKLVREAVETHTPAIYKANPGKYSESLFRKKGDAVVRGYINGYTPSLNSNTVIVYYGDDLYNTDTPTAVEIQSDGRFEAKIPLEYPKTLVCMGKPRINIPFFASPGDTLMIYMDLQEIVSAKNMNDPIFKYCTQFRYMGEPAEYNYYKSLAEKIIPDNQNVYGILQTWLKENKDTEFKTLVMGQVRGVQDSLSSLFRKYNMSDTTKEMLYNTLTLSRYQPLLDYEMYKRSSKYDTKQDENGRWTATRNENYRPLDPAFNDYLTMEMLDNPFVVALLMSDAYFNRLEFGNVLGTQLCNNDLIDCILESENNLPQSVADSLNAMRRDDQILSWTVGTPEGSLMSRYNENAYRIVFNRMQKRGLDRNISFDVILCRGLNQKIGELKKENLPSSVFQTRIEEMLSQMLPYVKTPFVCRKMLELYAANLTPVQAKTDTEKTKGDLIFDSLTAPYKGNVLYIDFWATTCGPCRAGMISDKPLVKELEGHKIKFIYISAEHYSSIGDYNKFINDNQIAGEHFRVSRDEWNHLAARFRINGIPHTMLIDKTGKILHSGTGNHPSKAQLLKLEEAE